MLPLEYNTMTSVFIIDDQPAFRRQLSEVLTYAGLQVVGEAGSIREALDILPFTPADLAVVDVQMPEVNGIEGAVLLKKEFAHLRVILVSGYGDSSRQLVEAAQEAGAEAFIPKDNLDLEVVRGWR